MWCRSAVKFSSFFSLAAFRTRSSACDTRSRPWVRCVLCSSAFPLAPALCPPTPQHQKRHARHGRSLPPCSSASQLVSRGLTSHARASSATAPHLPDADRRPWTERSNASSPGSQRQGASAHARFFDHAGPPGHSRCRAHACCLPPFVRRRHPEPVAFRGSMAGLCTPLPALRGRPRGRLRTARGRCGSLLLHRGGLSPPTPCRFHRRTQNRNLATAYPSAADLLRRLRPIHAQ